MPPLELVGGVLTICALFFSYLYCVACSRVPSENGPDEICDLVRYLTSQLSCGNLDEKASYCTYYIYVFDFGGKKKIGSILFYSLQENLNKDPKF